MRPSRHQDPPDDALLPRVLLVEDRAADAELCIRLLRTAGLDLHIERARSRTQAAELLGTHSFDVVITDHGLPDGSATDVVALARERDPDMPCIVFTGSLDDRAAAALLSHGAADYIQKDRPARLPGAVRHALEARRAQSGAAAAVRSLEQRQRDIAGRLIGTLENMREGFLALDRDCRYTYVNRHAAEILGREPGAMLGKHAWEDFPKDRRATLQQACENAMRSGQPAVIEEPFLLSARWLEGRIFPTPEGVALFFSDVTERRETQDALRASEARFRSVVESAASGMIMVDRAGSILFVNRSVERDFGYAREDLIGRPVEMLVPARYRASHPAHRAGFAAAPTARPMGTGRELFGVHQDGHEFPVEIGLTPLDGAAGPATLATIVDISERKRVSVERDALARRLIELQESERRALANELHDEVGQLLTGLHLLLEGRAGGDAHDAMVQLVREALARVRDVSMNLRPPMLDELGLRPTLDWLVQRYTNHTGIAVRFTRGAGPAVPVQRRDRVLPDRAGSADQRRPARRGPGRRAGRALRRRQRAAAGARSGRRIRRGPCARGAGVPRPPRDGGARPPPRRAAGRDLRAPHRDHHQRRPARRGRHRRRSVTGQVTIVLADDHQVVREGLRRLLEGERGFTVVGESADGLAAVSLVERLKPRVVVVDLMMPGLGGVEVARQLRERAPDARVIILSMHSAEAFVRDRGPGRRSGRWRRPRRWRGWWRAPGAR